MPALTQLTELWNRLDRRARMTVIVAAILCVCGLVAFTRFGSGTAYTVLYSNLSAEDAGQITEKLKADKTPYRLTEGGGTIEVPTERVYEARLSLAREGLPSSGEVGFEIFDKSGLPGTQFSNRVNYQRALQGELARTIGAMSEVHSARVHLVLPEEDLFSEKTPASASVVLQPRPGAQITPEMTAAIAHVVASAVQEVSAEQVTIVDNSGRVLRGPDSGKFGGLTANQFEIEREYEERLTLSLQSMLDSVLGPNQSVVRVQAQLDFDAEEIKNENVIPVARGKGLVTTEKISQEEYRGNGRENGGSIGLQPNLGSGETISTGNSGAYLQRDETRQYEFSRNTTSMVKAPGKVKTLAIAAVVDDDLTGAAEEQVRQVILAAGGVDRERGDVVTVQRMKIEAAELAKAQEKELGAADAGRRRQGLLQAALRGGLTLAAAGLILVSVVMALKQMRGPLANLEQLASQAALTPEPEPAQQRQVPTEEELNSTMRDQLRQITQEDSGAVAGRLLTLLQEDRR